MPKTKPVIQPIAAKDQIGSFIDRIERLQSEKDAIADDISNVYSEAQNMGLCTKTLRRVIRERKIDAVKRQEAEAIFELYWGVLEGTPLGNFARSQAA